METLTVDELTERVIDWRRQLPWLEENSGVVAAALAELTAGEPVEVARIAERAGAPAADVLEFLHSSPAEFDQQGRLLGFGLTLRPTPHRLKLDGRWLYAWCAPDALGFPVILDKRAQIESPCFATGETVRIELAPDGVRAVEPEQAVVSIVMADIQLANFRQRLCDQGHFFKSANVADDWLSSRPNATVVPVRDGFAVTRALLTDWLGAPEDASGDVAGGPGTW